MKIKLGAAALVGAAAAVGCLSLLANGKKPINTILDNPPAPIVKTMYTPPSGPSVQPVDFEKAAAAAVPAVVHIKTITKFKETAQPGQDQQDPFGDPFGGNDFFRHFFGDQGNG